MTGAALLLIGAALVLIAAIKFLVPSDYQRVH